MKKLFIEGDNPYQRGYFGWQNHNTALYGMRYGYKDSADKLVDIAIEQGKKSNIRILDTYIFPIVFSYRHSLEASLKLISYRFNTQIPKTHSLVKLWNNVMENVILKSNEDETLDEIKKFNVYAEGLYIDEILFKELESLFKEFNDLDSNSDVFRYLIDTKGELYFTDAKNIDYLNLKDTMDYLHTILDAIYIEVDRLLSGY